MAKIPQFGGLQLNGAKTGIPSNLVSAGNGIRKFGEGLNAVADLILQKKREDDQLQYQKALLDLDAFGSDELNNPETGYKNLQGENAISEAGNYNQRYIDKVSEIRESLKGNAFLDNFDLQSKSMSTSHIRQLMAHESNQQSALALKTIQSGIDLAITNAESLYNDPMSLDIGYQNLITRVDQFSSEQGMPEELRKTQIEGIKQNYFSSALDGWVANTELTGGSFAELSEKMKKSLPFKKLSEINQAKYLLKLDTLTRRQSNELKDNLNLDLSNAWAMQQRGIEAPEIPLNRFNAVYGDKGQQAYDAYQDQQIMARNIGAMQNMPTRELLQYTREDIGTKGDLSANKEDSNFAERLKLQGVRAKSAIVLLKARHEDPIAAAYRAGEINDLDFSQESIKQRITQAVRISKDYKTPLQIFSNTESEQLSSLVNNASATQQTELLEMLAKSSGDNTQAYNVMLNQVGFENPAFAAAGHILNSFGTSDSVIVKNRWLMPDDTVDKKTTALFILKGIEALKGAGKGDAKIKGVSLPPKALEEFDNIAGRLFADDAIAKQAVYSTAMAYYTGKTIINGKYVNNHELDLDLLKESINAVMGSESHKYNVRMPWGFSENTFENMVEAQYERIANDNGWLETDNLKKYGYDPTDPYRLTRKPLSERFTLVPSTYLSGQPDGKYLIKAGNEFLIDNNGATIVIDVLESIKPIKPIEDIPE